MTLTLHYHPLSSYCWKVLIPLYEAALPFTPNVVNLRDPESGGAFRALWPIGKFPVIEDDGMVVAESTPIIEWLAHRYPSAASLLPPDFDRAFEVRKWDRFFDLHVHAHMQAISADRLRPVEQRDPLGVSQARQRMAVACDFAERHMQGRAFAAADGFSMADCAAAPALFYGNWMAGVLDGRPALAAYLDRLKVRPSFARVLSEAEPFFQYVPKE